MIYCPYCGATISDGMTFCKECGFKLKNEPQPDQNTPEQVAEPVSPAPVEPTPVQTEPEPVKPEPKLEEPAPPAEPRAGTHKNTGPKSKNPHLKGIIIAIVVIIVGIALINVPPSETQPDDSPYALVTVTVYNDEDVTLTINVTDGTTSYYNQKTLESGYYYYSYNYKVVKLDGDTQTVTIKATGTASSGKIYTDSETLTLQDGEEYKVVLRL